MTLTDLRYIVALAQERHFGRAAEKCHVSQPTLSVAVKKLEEQLGVLLFERSAVDVKVTEIGRLIVAQAERVMREASQIRDLAESGRDAMSGPLRIGVIYTIAPYLLPALIPLLAERAPRMPLMIQENYTHRLADQLKKGEIDVAIIALPFTEQGIVSQPVYDEPFRVVLPASHAWTKEKEISSLLLQEEPLLLLGAGNCFRDQVIEACPRCAHGTGLQKTMEGSSLETIRYMVASGLGITVLPSSAADPLVDKQDLVAIRPFAAPEPSRRVAIAWRVTYPRTKVIDLLRAAILDSKLPGVRTVGG
ncbi:oxidative stress transcriptional regulator OxyR [Uliginosibacterium flavum]|uniref:LysR substrate-binding domain-containing protein n=1 Tax=Uliginosibacterium flavum TaxID=1396831 RepID=A0ABV2TM61_9RHOO